ncbi:MAG: tRNA preQ1(34) S-adenosylmethionine ribosyltransferase-isomerase QueA [Erysipelothrix sp.]|nr:tRNA preQ1(34) S-adenosylmethionine ribosyltransferase-isomerase QueA [Erysipelothrix sp.]
MKTSDFSFELPKELIAQTPLSNRSASKLMVLDKEEQSISHHHFDELINFLRPNDLLVMNNTKVIPARLFGTKEETHAHVELLILKIVENKAECLVGNAKVVKIGTVITFGEGLLKALCVEVKDEGIRVFELIFEGILMELLDTLGEMPLPPYIHEKLEDKNRYQTVYAKVEGSAAAPTAGLHFTPELLKQIKDKGISIAEITLHVGLGTFRPVKVDDVHQHVMHLEEYEVSEEVATLLNEAKSNSRRIISIGTTTTRVLESQMSRYGKFVSEQSSTDIFIYPGYQFKAIDALVTNFHLPESTLLMLVSAFSSKEFIMKAYQEAIDYEYRFFSFGDSMLIQ